MIIIRSPWLTCSRSTGPLFLCALSFEDTTKWSRNYLIQMLKVLFLNSLVHSLIFDLCTGLFSEKTLYSCGGKRVPILCIWFLVVLPKSPFYIYTYQKNSRIFIGSLCRPSSGVLKIQFFYLIPIEYTEIYYIWPSLDEK